MIIIIVILRAEPDLISCSEIQLLFLKCSQISFGLVQQPIGEKQWAKFNRWMDEYSLGPLLAGADTTT